MQISWFLADGLPVIDDIAARIRPEERIVYGFFRRTAGQ
jgi:hypothetical protein